MRVDASRIADILDCAQAIAERLSRHSLETLMETPDAVKATFYDIIVMGEAMRDLVARKDSWGAKIGEDARIVRDNPHVPWASWVGMRDMVTHQYFRAAPELVWRDYESGELQKLIDCCATWREEA